MDHIMNPFYEARLSLLNSTKATPEYPDGAPMSQRDVAADTGTTQAFVQKVEAGLTGTAPLSLSNYYDQLLSADKRIEMLNRLVTNIREVNVESPNPIKIPRRFIYGSPHFSVPTVGGLYSLYVIYSRAILPALSDLLDTYDKRHSSNYTAAACTRDMARRCQKTSDEQWEWGYTLAGFLKLNPYIIQRWEKLNKEVPPTLRIAVAGTGRTGNA